LILSCGLAVITGVVVHIWFVPWQRREILKKMELMVAAGTADSLTDTPSPSHANSIQDFKFNLPHSIKHQNKDMSTSTNDTRTIGIGGNNKGAMSAST
jgi:hypothetical protein